MIYDRFKICSQQAVELVGMARVAQACALTLCGQNLLA